jgi:hypothetical protein
MAWYYTFEAKEIQRFILQSDKLRDMVGGSELVSQLCDKFLIEALSSVGVENPVEAIIANAAGWARIIFNEREQAETFYAHWPLAVSRFAPGLQLIQALVEQSGTLPEAMDAGFKLLREARNRNLVQLPEIGPLMERYIRTGGAAVKTMPEREEKVFVDRQTWRKRMAVKKGSSLTGKISEEYLDTEWPYEIEEIADGKSSYVAVIHADGNDLGATIMKIGDHLKARPDDAAAIFRAFSEAIDEATRAAAASASEATIFADYRSRSAESKKAKIAARPIVLGGDDLTIIVRADLALEFTRVFLEKFEEHSRAILDDKLEQFHIAGRPQFLTACAGIAFVKKAYPFSSAYHMAETLCDHSKHEAKANRVQHGAEKYVPSSFTFHRITTSMAEGFREVKAQELTGRAAAGTKPLRFWFGPYAVGAHGGALPAFQKLRDLSRAAAALPSGSIRTLIDTLHRDPVTARNDYGRILQVANAAKGTVLDQAFAALTEHGETVLWNRENHTPILDAHLLSEINGDADDNGHA